MKYQDDLFPFKTVLSLKPIIDYWKGVAAGDRPIHSEFARTLLQQVESVPELKEPIEDLETIEKHRELVDLLMSAVMPLGLSDTTYSAAVVPFQPISFFVTPGFEKLNLVYHLLNYFQQQGKFISVGKSVKAYRHLLGELYQRDTPLSYPMFLPVTSSDSGLTRYFKIDFDTRFTELKINGTLPELTEEDFDDLMAHRTDLEVWHSKLPASLFEFYGFTILTAVEVTEGQIVSVLKNDLLQKDALSTPAKIDLVQSRIRSLLREPNIELGLVAVEQGEFNTISSIHPLGRSILLKQGVAPNCPMWKQSAYADVTDGRMEPVIIHNLDRYEHRTGFEEYLLQQGYKSLLLAPLYSEDRLVGILELASPRVNELDTFAAFHLKEITSLFAVAIHRGLDEQEDRIQAIIKEQYTSIHPTVEWRFREAAGRYLQHELRGEPAGAESIVFQDVYPIYGLSDIRGSSEQRNIAIQADLIDQLNLAHAVLLESQKHRPLHVIDELCFRIATFAAEIGAEIRSGDELNILHFLRDEVEPLFEELGSFDETVEHAVQEYRHALDPELGVLYRQRQQYEESVRKINDTIGAYIEGRELEAQKMFPHFFEMFKTDGVDYNIYVGASLVRNKTFDKLYLHNLRLWQLLMTCGVHWQMEKLLPDLEVKLETAHLILVQDIPLGIRFRIDEKKFDVDGAYNIRYEIVKKRIDKARINGTGERLTQPGHIAIVYSQEHEAFEYRRYLRYMRAAGYLSGDVEEVELEDLQGVHGLKALRVRIRSSQEGLMDGPASNLAASFPHGDGAHESVVSLDLEAQN